MDSRQRRKGIAFILTIGIVMAFVLLVAGFYQVLIGRQRWTNKRNARDSGWYKSEAGMQDAVARLRLAQMGSVPMPGGPGINPVAGRHYCLNIATSTVIASSAPPGNPACVTQGTNNILVRVSARGANGLNRIDVLQDF